MEGARCLDGVKATQSRHHGRWPLRDDCGRDQSMGRWTTNLQNDGGAVEGNVSRGQFLFEAIA